MNPVIEEAIKNMIRRIEIVESQVRKMNFVQTMPPLIIPNTASQSQIDYLRRLGGKAWEGMSKQEAGKRIDARTKNKSHPKSLKVTEPKEVDTEDAGLDGDLI